MQFKTKLGLVDIPNDDVMAASRDIMSSAGSPSEIAAPLGSLSTGDLFGHARRWWAAPFRYDPEGQIVWDANGARVLDIRGWGYLTGGSAHNLDIEHAAKIQDDLGQSVAKMLTAYWLNTGGQPRP